MLSWVKIICLDTVYEYSMLFIIIVSVFIILIINGHSTSWHYSITTIYCFSSCSFILATYTTKGGVTIESFIHHRVVEHYLQFNFSAVTCRLRAEGHFRLLYFIILSTDIWIETLRHIKLREIISSCPTDFYSNTASKFFSPFFFLLLFFGPFKLFLFPFSFLLSLFFSGGGGKQRHFAPPPSATWWRENCNWYPSSFLYFFLNFPPLYLLFPSFLLTYFVLWREATAWEARPPFYFLLPLLSFPFSPLSLSLFSFSLSLSLSLSLFCGRGGGEGKARSPPLDPRLHLPYIY